MKLFAQPSDMMCNKLESASAQMHDASHRAIREVHCLLAATTAAPPTTQAAAATPATTAAGAYKLPLARLTIALWLPIFSQALGAAATSGATGTKCYLVSGCVSL